ncbi:uncharacterized protein TRIREDRAFT_122096 [Trichoderma reesei QM6a]|uniref:Predicted protein n=1 Tax=Hypocrea jecorina (strain QM6a) TaxID=431241 RepID=G0RKT4_HYPJQ|nr:uncharacterized protein TRIREDRAFT_122096 [Trichoderma reesei QM6a]EGR48453.1 predicted protein [Trichoderma reesei QM6a]
MFVKSAASAGLLLALANYASASPVLAKRVDVVAPAVANKFLLTPDTPADNDGSNLSLKTEESYIWSHQDQGIVANMTLQAASGFRLLTAINMQDVVESVDCATEDITIKFGSAESLQAAQEAWKWVNADAANTMIYVAEGQACAGTKGRQPFSVESISYDAVAQTALMAASLTKWKDFVEDASIRIAGVPVDATGSDAQAVKRRGVSKDVTIDIGHDFSGPIFNTDVDGISVALNCDSCKTHGTADADITLSLSSGFSASVRTHNSFGADMDVSLTASGTLTDPLSFSVPIATVPLAGFSIADLVDFGPQLNIAADASVSAVSASATASLGVSASLPDGSGFTLGQTADIQPNVQTTKLGVTGSVSVAAKVGPVVSLELVASFLGKGVVGGLALQAPVLSAKFEGSASTMGMLACGNNTAEVSLELDVGVELDGFAGFGGAGDRPNQKAVFQKDAQVFKSCLTV